MFTHAIVRRPGKNMLKGISDANLGLPDYQKAIEQHEAYIHALQHCGLELEILDIDVQHPDSSFVEDTALLTPHCAIISRPGARTRRTETSSIRRCLHKYFSIIEEISAPGTLDAGDIMRVGDHYYIGLSERTNLAGARQMKNILQKWGLGASLIEIANLLHLKSGVAYLEHNILLISDALSADAHFKPFNRIHVSKAEAYAANCLWINGTVLIPKGFAQLTQNIANAGYETLILDMSEFRKLDGGLSCLSLRF